MEMIRLNKFLSEAGVCSRREADRLIGEGRITVDGISAVTGMKIDPSQVVRLDGQAVQIQTRKVLVVLNKPRGAVCTSSRRWGDELAEDLVDIPERIYPIGRLDKESEGLLLLTNQGDLLNKIMKSENRHEKEYEVTIDRSVNERELDMLAAGVYLPELDRTTRPCRIKKIGERKICFVLTQGLNRQIRRMCALIGANVVRLRRTRIMNIRLGTLQPGQWRFVTDTEYRELLELLKGSANNTEKRWQGTDDKKRV